MRAKSSDVRARAVMCRPFTMMLMKRMIDTMEADNKKRTGLRVTVAYATLVDSMTRDKAKRMGIDVDKLQAEYDAMVRGVVRGAGKKRGRAALAA
jgi:ribosomal protein L13E